jgi:hypothetical protein
MYLGAPVLCFGLISIAPKYPVIAPGASFIDCPNYKFAIDFCYLI